MFLNSKFFTIERDLRHTRKSVIAIHKTFLVVQYVRGVKPVLEVRILSDGSFIQDIPLPIGSIGKISGFRNDGIIFFSFTTFFSLSIIYSYDFENKTDGIKVRIFKKVIQSILIT
jgi:hypothetical protein